MSTPDPNERLLQRLRGLREDVSDDGFSAQLHRRLVEAGAPEKTRMELFWAKWKMWLWPLSGVAAGVAAYVVLTLTAPLGTSSQTRSVELPVASQQPLKVGSEVPVTKVAVLKLDFSVDADVEEADFQVSLPDGLVFWVEGEALAERAFRWTQPLKEGSNVVPIAVRGNKPGLYTVSARARIGDQEVVHDVVLEVTSG